MQHLAVVQAAATKRGRSATLADRVSEELSAVGRLDTVDGQSAVLLATKAESALTNASQAAAAVRELRTVMAAALQGAAKADKVDDLASRRRRVSGQ